MNLTIAFIGIIILAIAVFDVWIIAKKGKRESVSAHIIRSSRKYPLLVLLFGITLGHLTWSMSDFDWRSPEDIIPMCEAYLKEHKK